MKTATEKMIVGLSRGGLNKTFQTFSCAAWFSDDADETPGVNETLPKIMSLLWKENSQNEINLKNLIIRTNQKLPA